MYFILGLLLFGMVIGGLAAMLVGGVNFRQIDWIQAIIAGILGSFVGGLVVNLITGHGIELHPAGFIGSFLGAVLILLVWKPKKKKASY
jgi:uncharacterized membrane protein YeaQ/YmgE (transglycosylase-associated protein family)